MSGMKACGRLVLGLALIVPVAMAAGSRKERIDSHWKDREIVIDGDDGEWAGPLVPFDDHQRLTTAAVNDGRFLYLVLSTRDATLRAQIMGQGLIVWFDPGGAEKKSFGIKFPVGMAGGDMPGRGRGFRRADPSGASDPADSPARTAPLDPPNRLELLGPGKDDAHSFVADRVPGVSVKVGQVEGALVYELKVPIGRDDATQYALGTKTGALIGIGLETPRRERPQREGRGMGGFGGGGGGMGRGGGMNRPDGFEPPKPLKAWALLQLVASR